jgi:uracil-DNA glycosylase
MNAGQQPTGAAPWVPPGATVAQLRSAVPDCRGCELFADAEHAVMGEGPEDASVMLLGEQPGAREDEAGRPFVGPAGRLLDEALKQAGFDPASVYRTNAVKHFRFERRGSQRLHKSPSRWHVAACEPWLLGELEAVRPDLVVLLGATAGQAVFGPAYRVKASRGRRLDWPAQPEGRFTPAAALGTTHPAAILRSRDRDTDLASLVADLEVARTLVQP